MTDFELLQQNVEGLKRRLTDVDGPEGRLTEAENLLEQIVELLEARDESGPWVWADMTAAQHESAWLELGEFVLRIDKAFLQWTTVPKLQLPECWWQHPIAVEELTALMVGYRAAYNTKAGAVGTALSDWIHRYLWPTLESIDAHAGTKTCRNDRKHSFRVQVEPLTLSDEFLNAAKTADSETGEITEETAP